MPLSPKREIAHKLEDISELERTRLAISSAKEIVYDVVVAQDATIWGENAHDLFKQHGLSVPVSRSEFVGGLKDEAAILLNSEIEQSAKTGSAFCLEYEVRNLLGGLCWIEDRGSSIADENGNLVRIIGLLRFVTDRKERESRLSYLAVYDDLTGFFNRVHVQDRINDTLNKMERDGTPSAYIVVGIDDLAVINESYGFEVADDVILEVSRRISRRLREEDVTSRVAGNKFGILINNCTREVMLECVTSIQEAVREDIVVTRSGPVSAAESVCCLFLPDGVKNAQDVMAKAEESLSFAKSQGRDRYHCFEASEQRESARRRRIFVADEIVSALNNNRVTLAYQPIVRADNNQPEFYECLLRLVDRKGNLMSAGDFVPVAEELGLIRELDRYVAELGIRKLKEHSDLKLSLNVSGLTATDPAWVRSMLDLIDRNSDVASRLIVEITETVAIRDIEESANFVSRLRELGCLAAIDDFGAGYTSFRNLQLLDINMVKIDGSFIRGVDVSTENQFFVRTLIDLANNFDLKTVAEWVGNESEADVLREMGIDYFQGFYHGRPEVGRF